MTPRERLMALTSQPDAVLFTGDGVPEPPEALAARITRLAAAGAIDGDDYSVGGIVERLEERWAGLVLEEVTRPARLLEALGAAPRGAVGRPSE
jgi:hypothetical protein